MVICDNDPYLNHFTQPDTIIPNPYNSASYDRYSYVLNNPLKYSDPSGRCEVEKGGHMVTFLNSSSHCGGVDVREVYTNSQLATFGITIAGGTANGNTQALVAARLLGGKVSAIIGGSVTDAFKKATGGNITINVGSGPEQGNCETTYGAGGSTIACKSTMDIANAIHEYFHVFDKHYQALSHWDDDNCDPAHGGCRASDYFPPDYLNDPHYQTGAYNCADIRCIAHPPDPRYGEYNSAEAFANLGQNWAGLNVSPGNSSFADNGFGTTLSGWMDEKMPIFLGKMGY